MHLQCHSTHVVQVERVVNSGTKHRESHPTSASLWRCDGELAGDNFLFSLFCRLFARLDHSPTQSHTGSSPSENHLCTCSECKCQCEGKSHVESCDYDFALLCCATSERVIDTRRHLNTVNSVGATIDMYFKLKSEQGECGETIA